MAVENFCQLAKTALMDNKIREIRKARGVTLEQLAEMTDLSTSYLSRIESGKRGLRLEPRIAIAEALKVEPTDLGGELKTNVPAGHVTIEGAPAELRRNASAKTDEIIEADIEFPKREDMPKDVPVWGVAAGSNEGAFIINVGEAIDYVRRPPGLAGKKDVFGIYVQGESMEPKFEAGELLYLDPHRPPRTRDYVVAVRQIDEVEQEAYVGRLAFRKGKRVALDKFNPSDTLELDNVKQIFRVISSFAELYGV